MAKVLQYGDEYAYTAVFPGSILSEQQKQGKEPVNLEFYTKESKIKNLAMRMSITSGDQCLSPLYLVWVRDMNLLQFDHFEDTTDSNFPHE